MRIIVVAGGTGGHIFPAVAIINKIKEKEKDSEVLYIGTTDRMEATIIPELGYDYVGLEIKGLNRKNPFKNIYVLKSFLKAISISKNEIKKFVQLHLTNAITKLSLVSISNIRCNFYNAFHKVSSYLCLYSLQKYKKMIQLV